MMKRRGFLGLLGAAAASPFLGNATSADPTTVPDAVPVSYAAVGYTGDQKMYWFIQANRTLEPGDLAMDADGRVLGVATGRIDRGNFGWVQVRGPASIKVSV